MGEPRTDHLVAVFRGTVTCAGEAGPSPGLTLRGASAEAAGEELILTFVGAAPEDLPAVLEAVSVVSVDAGCYRIHSPPRQWLVWARALYVHRDMRAAFFEAVPARRVPFGKRLFWRVVLGLARWPACLRLLGRLRGR